MLKINNDNEAHEYLAQALSSRDLDLLESIRRTIDQWLVLTDEAIGWTALIDAIENSIEIMLDNEVIYAVQS